MRSNPHRFPIRRRFDCHQPGLRFVSVALLVLLCLTLWPLHSATATESSAEKPRLVTRGDGLSIIQAISEYRDSLPRHAAKPDCSHLVNDVYDLAGFPYPYAKSSDLYAGHSNFVRVNSPQPGDLIVWRGHVGLVISKWGFLPPGGESYVHVAERVGAWYADDHAATPSSPPTAAPAARWSRSPASRRRTRPCIIPIEQGVVYVFAAGRYARAAVA